MTASVLALFFWFSLVHNGVLHFYPIRYPLGGLGFFFDSCTYDMVSATYLLILLFLFLFSTCFPMFVHGGRVSARAWVTFEFW